MDVETHRLLGRTEVVLFKVLDERVIISRHANGSKSETTKAMPKRQARDFWNLLRQKGYIYT
jgi:hypothetical protein